jgi:soluble lytic murein transglycosylase-like protein
MREGVLTYFCNMRRQYRESSAMTWLSLGVFVIACAFLRAVPAEATVYEITDSGAVVVLNQPPAAAVKPTRNDSRNSPETRLRPPPAPERYRPYVEAAAERYQLSPALLHSVAHHESRYRQDAISSARAIGIMQLMPGTAADLGVNPHEARDNIFGGAAYLRQMLDRFDGDIVRALAAYNAGPGAVERARGVPPYRETQTYVARIMGTLSEVAQ